MDGLMVQYCLLCFTFSLLDNLSFGSYEFTCGNSTLLKPLPSPCTLRSHYIYCSQEQHSVFSVYFSNAMTYSFAFSENAIIL